MGLRFLSLAGMACAANPGDQFNHYVEGVNQNFYGNGTWYNYTETAEPTSSQAPAATPTTTAAAAASTVTTSAAPAAASTVTTSAAPTTTTTTGGNASTTTASSSSNVTTTTASSSSNVTTTTSSTGDGTTAVPNLPEGKVAPPPDVAKTNENNEELDISKVKDVIGGAKVTVDSENTYVGNFANTTRARQLAAHDTFCTAIATNKARGAACSTYVTEANNAANTNLTLTDGMCSSKVNSCNKGTLPSGVSTGIAVDTKESFTLTIPVTGNTTVASVLADMKKVSAHVEEKAKTNAFASSLMQAIKAADPGSVLANIDAANSKVTGVKASAPQELNASGAVVKKASASSANVVRAAASLLAASVSALLL